MKTPKKQTVLVTGCSSGIGHCVALGLKARGHRVIATARKQQDIEQLKKEGLTACYLELEDSDSLKNTVEFALQHGNNRIDALFNNAAYGQPGAVEDLSRQVLRQQLEVNLLGTLELSNLVIPHMRRQRYGRIIQNSSVLGLISLPYRGAYNCSKYALEGLSDTLRLELNGTGIDVCLVEPGPIESRFRANAFAAYQKNIDKTHSPHRDIYQAMENRLKKQGPAAPFTLGPEAVLKKVIHALESPKPKARYYVTFPTYLFATLKRLLTHRGLDKVLLKVSHGEHQD